MMDNLEDDFHQGYASGLEEFHNEVEEDLEERGGDVKTDFYRSQYHYSAPKSYIMYHGTTWNNAEKIQSEGFIRSSDGMLGPGVYLSRNFNKASRYPLNSKFQDRAVLKLSVRVGKVKKIDYQGHPLQKTWHQHGYATAWVPPNCGMVPSGLEEDCVYDPRRIKVLKIITNSKL